MIMVDAKVLEQLEQSTCFGKAYDPTKECKKCDMQQECAARTASNSTFDSIKRLNPETEKAMAEVKRKTTPEATSQNSSNNTTTKKEKKAKAANPPGMPETKGMDIPELLKLLEERGGSCAVYDNPAIYKMRLIMAVKATYK